MRTTDDILKDLAKRGDAGEDVTQQVNSHRALALLRADRAEAVQRGDHALVTALDSQIGVHRGLVDTDVDERVAEQPKKDSVRLVEPDRG